MYEMLLLASTFGPGKYAMTGEVPPPARYETLALPKGFKSYEDGKREATWAGVPLVVFVGVQPRDIPGAVSCWVHSLNEGRIEGSIVVATPNVRVGLEWRDTLPANATDLMIRRAAGLVVSQQAIPFSRRNPAKLTADDSWLLRQLPFLSELEPYESAKRVQVSFRRFSGYISSEPREASEAKWNVAGGLLGVQGWTNTLYHKARASVSLGYVKNDAITWQPTFEDGAVFADVLRDDSGTVFEVRVAEKTNGAWDRYVAYRDAGAFPVGYSPIRRNSCRECHDRAGDTPYGGVAVPGGDTIFSHPIPQVESGGTFQGGYGLNL